jgi:DNA-binding MarR family transcriptional regulator
MSESVELIRLIRRNIHLLTAWADRMHGDLDITASMRAVMESLDEGGPQTVPQIARAKGVSRQHIQAIVDQLVPAGLAASAENPAHRRSKLIALTPRGQDVFNEIRRREAPVFAALEAALPTDELRAANAALRRLHAFMTSLDRKGTRS